MSSADASHTADNSTVEVSIIVLKVITTATALRIESFDTVRLNISAELLFLIVEKAEHKSTTIVTVFMPPAVPTGEPPTNIRRRERKTDAVVRDSCGMV